MAAFRISLIYIDEDPHNRDAKRFAKLVRSHPAISIYDPKIYHIRTIERTFSWLRENPPPLSDGVYIVCWDTSFDGANQIRIEEGLNQLYELGIDRDCVMAMPSGGQTDLLWSVLKGKLGSDHVISKSDVHLERGADCISESISLALGKRTSNPNKVIQLSLLTMEGRLEGLVEKIHHLESGLDTRLDRYLKSSDILRRLQESIQANRTAIETIKATLFPSHELSGTSIVSMVTDLRRMVASQDKELSKLDQDIGKLADITELRRNHLEEETIEQLAKAFHEIETLQTEMQELRHQDENLKSLLNRQQMQSEHRNALAMARQDFFLTTGGRVVVVTVSVLGLILLTQVAPSAINLLEGIVRALMN